MQDFASTWCDHTKREKNETRRNGPDQGQARCGEARERGAWGMDPDKRSRLVGGAGIDVTGRWWRMMVGKAKERVRGTEFICDLGSCTCRAITPTTISLCYYAVGIECLMVLGIERQV